MLTIANPIYDSVFKFLMEDTRVARTILSALLKMDILEVRMRPHEYSNSQRDTLSMFRIDFGATVRNSDGSQQMILIEVQKTWLETETLRFRQYLGAQYQRKDNIIAECKEGYAMPMVAVYILGHKVGDIEEPVLYVQHEAYDYNENRVTKGLPNPFVDSLTHNSIIVQIPRLHGQINNRLDKVLSVFDQTLHAEESEHFLNYDDSPYGDDDELQPILHRLLMAAADADTRQDMNVEDEYYSIIEKRDTDIMIKDKQLAEKTVLLQQKDEQLSQKDEQLSQKDEQLSQKDEQLSQKDEQLSQKDEQLSQKDEQLSQKDEQLSQKDEQLSQKDEQLSQKDEQLSQKDEQLSQKEEQLSQKDEQLRRSVQLLLKAGLSIETIAEDMNMPIEHIQQLVQS